MLSRDEIREKFSEETWQGLINIMENHFSKAIEEMEDQTHDTVLGVCPQDCREDNWCWIVWDLMIEDALETWGYFSNRNDLT